MLSSNYHTEMSPGDVGHNDRYVVQAIIKDMAKNRPLDATGRLDAAVGLDATDWERLRDRGEALNLRYVCGGRCMRGFREAILNRPRDATEGLGGGGSGGHPSEQTPAGRSEVG